MILDRRLVARARPARLLLAVDTGLGVATIVPILAQAGLLAAIVTTAFDGEPVAGVRLELAALVLAFAARGALAWGMEVSGRRAAAGVLSELRARGGAAAAAPRSNGRRRRADG